MQHDEIPPADVVVLGAHIAKVVRTHTADELTIGALQRLYDAMARQGLLDWGVGPDRLLPGDEMSRAALEAALAYWTSRDRPVAAVSIQVQFDDGIVVGRILAEQLRAAALPSDDLAALRRTYDAFAKAGMRDWRHDGMPRRHD